MNTIIYIMRHGHVHNPKNVIYGRLPGFQLSQSGKESINSQVDFFVKEQLDIIYCSPLLRTRQTAGIIANATGLKPKMSKFLIEVQLWNQGVPLSEFKKIQPHIYNDKYLKIGQESVEEIRNRMLRFIAMIRRKHPGKKVLAVTHGDPIVILMAALNNVPFTWQYKRDNYVATGTFIKVECTKDGYKLI